MLDRGVQSGNLPQLNHLSLAGATLVDGQQSFQILSQWSSLSYLNLFDCELSDNDIQALCLSNPTALLLSRIRTLKRSSHGIETNDKSTTSHRRGTKLVPKFLKNPMKSRKDSMVSGLQLNELAIFELTSECFWGAGRRFGSRDSCAI